MKYNKTLDLVALAIEASTLGKPNTAAKLFAQAVTNPDCEAAIRIIEASNQQAFDQQAKELKASREALAAKAKAKVTASKRLKASEEAPVVDDEEIGEDEPVEADLVEDEDSMEGPLDEEILAEEEFGEEDETDDAAGAAFAKVLASMVKPAAKAPVKAAAKAKK